MLIYAFLKLKNFIKNFDKVGELGSLEPAVVFKVLHLSHTYRPLELNLAFLDNLRS